VAYLTEGGEYRRSGEGGRGRKKGGGGVWWAHIQIQKSSKEWNSGGGGGGKGWGGGGAWGGGGRVCGWLRERGEEKYRNLVSQEGREKKKTTSLQKQSITSQPYPSHISVYGKKEKGFVNKVAGGGSEGKKNTSSGVGETNGEKGKVSC